MSEPKASDTGTSPAIRDLESPVLDLVGQRRETRWSAWYARLATQRVRLTEHVMDRRISTRGRQIELDHFEPDNVQYEPSGWSYLPRALRHLRPTPGDVFLDLGAGKGRVLYQAAKHPFGRVIGVEIAERLAAVARTNLQANAERLRCQDIEVVTGDAADYEIPDDVTYIYLFYPFVGQTFSRVLAHITDSLQRRPRTLRLIYASPRLEAEILATGWFRRERLIRLHPRAGVADQIGLYVAESPRAASPARPRMALGWAIHRTAALLPRPVLDLVQGLVSRNRRVRGVVRRVTAPMRSGAHTIARGPAQGLLMDVAGSRPSYLLGTAEPDVVAVFERHLSRGDVALDLGANVGFFTLVSAALVGPEGRVVAFEPLPDNAAALRRNVALNALAHVAVVEAAVSDSEGSADLTLGESDQVASLAFDDRGEETIRVETVTIDAEMQRRGLAPTMIKIDVEGAEDAVVRGAIETLTTHRPVVLCEIHEDKPSVNYGVPKMLADLGYELSWLQEFPDGERFWAPHLVAVPKDG
jgi:FkbM family methyltransferase